MSNIKDKNFGQLAAQIAGITNVETLATTSNAVIMPNPTAHILVRGTVEVSNGAGAATVTLKLYRGASLSGTLVKTCLAVNVIATGKISIPFEFEEDLANSAGAQYTVSATNSVNQAANNIDFANITVEVL